MMKTLFKFAVLVLTVVFMIEAHAADSGIYVGGAVSQSTIETESDFFGFSFDDDDTGYKFIAGIRLFDAFAVEMNYVDFGSIVFDDGSIVADGIRSEYEATALDAFAVGFFGIGPAEAFGKLGVVYWDADSRIQGGLAGLDLSSSDSGTDIVFGLGGQINLGSLSLRLEFESFDVSGADKLDLWSLGLTYTFL